MVNKTFLGIFFLVVVVSTITYMAYLQTKPQMFYTLKVTELKQGWAYEVYYKDQLLIQQNHIPGIENRKSFMTKYDAEKVGYLVINKLNQKKSPYISKEDLKKAGIAH